MCFVKCYDASRLVGCAFTCVYMLLSLQHLRRQQLHSELQVSSNSAVVEESPHEAMNCLASLTDLSHAFVRRGSQLLFGSYSSVSMCVVFTISAISRFCLEFFLPTSEGRFPCLT